LAYHEHRQELGRRIEYKVVNNLDAVVSATGHESTPALAEPDGSKESMVRFPSSKLRLFSSDMQACALDVLEHESIFVIREAAAQFDRVAILFSGGKDSVVAAHLAMRAFAPAPPPFPLLHIDTGHNFPETIEFRDEFAANHGFELIVRRVEDSIAAGRAAEEPGPYPSRNAIQSITLLDAISELKLDATIGGARRDEERARAKERFFSHRPAQGDWRPKSQRPEVWNLLNGRKATGENFRVFPLSNWTELDVWYYILRHGVPVPRLYFAHPREVVSRGNVWMAASPFVAPLAGDVPEVRTVRYRTVGDATCTGAIESRATTVELVVEEIGKLRLSERSTRVDDQRSDAAMEDRKRQGYF
jgi:sulfate adenylyltransferase subunit 2